MKEQIHPDYHEVNIIMTDGSTFKTRTTWGKAGDTMRLDIDPKTHPAWTGQVRMMNQGGQLAKFNNRFAGIGAVAVKPSTGSVNKAEKKPEAKDAKGAAKKK